MWHCVCHLVCDTLERSSSNDILFFRSEKRRMRQQWEREWGSISKEGNIWWLGSGRDGWVDVMGTNPMGWLCESYLVSIHFHPAFLVSGLVLYPRYLSVRDLQPEVSGQVVSQLCWMLDSVLAWTATSAVLANGRMMLRACFPVRHLFRHPWIVRGGSTLMLRMSEGDDSDRAVWCPPCSLSFLRG